MKNTPPKPFIYNPPMEPYLSVVYHDKDILVLDKPTGLLSVTGRGEGMHDCLDTRAKQQFRKATIVHRLDNATSGVMIMALNIEAHRNLSSQFEQRKIKKTYIARVWGKVKEDKGHIDLPLICDWENRPKQMVDFKIGKPAQTNWQVIEREENATRLRLFPITGRSHQLRVHMLNIGHPILGDNFYAHDEALNMTDRLQLHAETITIHHPETNEELCFNASCPF